MGRERTAKDGCRRYMPHAIMFNTQALTLTEEINPEWAPAIVAQHEENRRQARMSVIHEFGNADHERKIQDYGELGRAPWTVLDQHNVFLAQVRDSFTLGAYYPALVGACALGERLLNELVILLRDSYTSHPAAVPVKTQKTFTDWVPCIKALFEWGVLDDSVASKLYEMRKLRNRSVHYGKHLAGSDARDDAIRAVHLVQEIVEDLFAPHGGPPRFIAGVSGHSFLALEAEDQPFIREFILPASLLVSPNFVMEFNRATGWFDVFDDDAYHDEFPTLSDAEFADHRMHPRRPS